MENYFNYFTEIEDRYLQRRGGGLLLSTLDWALIETWKDAGIPLEAVLRGIDAAFDRYDQRPAKSKKINSLAYCSQEVLAAAEEMKEARVGADNVDAANKEQRQGFDAQSIETFLARNADLIEKAKTPDPVRSFLTEMARTLRQMAHDTKAQSGMRLEDLERRLTVMEEKMFAVLLTNSADEEVVTIRAEADRDLAPYRRKMSGPQIDQLHKQYVHKRLLEKYKLPRLSLFYL